MDNPQFCANLWRPSGRLFYQRRAQQRCVEKRDAADLLFFIHFIWFTFFLQLKQVDRNSHKVTVGNDAD